MVAHNTDHMQFESVDRSYTTIYTYIATILSHKCGWLYDSDLYSPGSSYY